MRALVDATPLLGTRTGVGEFTARLLDGLRRRADVDIDTYSISWKAGSVRLPARVVHEVWRRVDWPPLVRGGDVVHGTNFVVPPRRGPRVVTVHDLTALRFPTLVVPATRAYPDLIRRAVRSGAWVHTPSQFVADEVVSFFDAPAERVRAVWHGVTPVDVDGVSPMHDFPYVLALGTIEPRKDLPTLVRAFDAMAASDAEVRLVVAGPDGWGVSAFNAAVDAARHRSRIVRHGWVGEQERAALLAGASVFAYPSLYEGFGLPVLEAMAAGVPVVTTSAGPLPEVAGDAAVLVPVGDVDGLAAALSSVLSDEGLRSGLVARGRARAARSWDDAAAELVGLYRDAVACAS